MATNSIYQLSEKTISGFALMIFSSLYRIFPKLGIDSVDLARVMVDVGIGGSDFKVYENKDLRAHMEARRSRYEEGKNS